MIFTFLLATRNRHKVRELRNLLNNPAVRLFSVDDFFGLPAVQEKGATFKENAVKKAVAVSRRTILPVLADDSGLEVRSLKGLPGVRSARYAGPAQDDRSNIAKLLKAMAKLPPSRRGARFVCVIALAAGGKLVRTFEGVCPGSIALEPQGRGGFGYDPVFIPKGLKRTMAELGPSRKNRISHRGRAARLLTKWLKTSL